MRRRHLIALLAAAILATLAPTPSFAQADGTHMTGINFNFANPGARARGIGGAFVAIADDATAALANPAGVAYLDRQFTLELIHDEEETLVGQQTHGGVDVEEVAGAEYFFGLNDPYRVRADSSSDRVNFASFVLPIPAAKIGLAIYYATLADIEQEYEIGSGLACVLSADDAFLPAGGERCLDDPSKFYQRESVSVRLTTDQMGVSLGWRLSDTFSIGGSVAYTQTDLRGVTDVLPDPHLNLDGVFLFESEIDDSDLMYSAGLLYRGDFWGFGASYRSESSFEIKNFSDSETVDPGEFRIPERISAGVAIFPGDNWVIAGEYVHLPYSTMPEGMTYQFKEDGFYGVNVPLVYSSSDVDEYHIGAEYTTFRDRRGWSVRVGYWRDESHLFFLRPTQQQTDTQAEIQAAAALFNQQLDQSYDHFTAGVGAAFGTFRFDAAVDYSSDAGTDFLLSGVFYF